MIRNALRQSARTVGAVAVPRGAALVSLKIHPTHMPTMSRHVCYYLDVALRSSRAALGALTASWLSLLNNANYLILPRAEPRDQQLSMEHQSKFEAMLPMLNQHQRKSLRSSSREFEAYKRKPVLPRQGVSCQLGT
jgi:hypothetical protein